MNLSHLTNALLTGTNNDQWGTNVNQPYASISGLKLNLPVNMIDAYVWSQDKIDINPGSGPTKIDLLNNKVTKIEQNNYIIGAYDLNFDHHLKSLIDLVNGGFGKNWYGQALKLGLLRVTTSNFNVLSDYQFKVVGIQHSYDQARIFLDQKWGNQVLGYQDSPQWFNGKYTKAIQPADQFQRYVLSSISADNALSGGLTFFSSAVGKVDYLHNKKQVVNQLSYFTTVLAGALVSIIIFLVTDVFMERYTKFIALMRVFGYRRGEINSMTLAIFIPFAILGWLLGFFLVWTSVYFAVKIDLQAINLPLSLPMPWLLFIIIFGIISFIFTLTFVLSTRKINQLPIQTIVTLSDE
ncbi:FtsX-like permease family protein [Spiroplasma endosymbiont of Sarcophaga carnaria]|uniref:FtsX-like permease family protein n=1 Tax=Spiroplasma endosymbiont of Sarcophaga carnaria TaxID=3066303 RepID=UPI0030D2558C